MPYTLAMGLVWFIAALVLGVVIGWLLRSVTARRKVPRTIEAAPAVEAQPVADDLKVIPGIGPNVEDLCHGIGIRTWSNLSVTDVSQLRTMLADAGPRFRAVDPSAWPELAGLLADGRMAEFEQRAAEHPGTTAK